MVDGRHFENSWIGLTYFGDVWYDDTPEFCRRIPAGRAACWALPLTSNWLIICVCSVVGVMHCWCVCLSVCQHRLLPATSSWKQDISVNCTSRGSRQSTPTVKWPTTWSTGRDSRSTLRSTISATTAQTVRPSLEPLDHCWHLWQQENTANCSPIDVKGRLICGGKTGPESSVCDVWVFVPVPHLM